MDASKKNTYICQCCQWKTKNIKLVKLTLTLREAQPRPQAPAVFLVVRARSRFVVFFGRLPDHRALERRVPAAAAVLAARLQFGLTGVVPRRTRRQHRRLLLLRTLVSRQFTEAAARELLGVHHRLGQRVVRHPARRHCDCAVLCPFAFRASAKKYNYVFSEVDLI